MAFGGNGYDNSELDIEHFDGQSWNLLETTLPEELLWPCTVDINENTSMLIGGTFSYGNGTWFVSKAQAVECFLRFWFVVKTTADNMILQIFDIFTNELSPFQLN